jgi:hypothetical protein
VYVKLDGRRLAMLSYGGAMTESIEPGRHTLQVDNTLFKKTIEFVAGVNDHIALQDRQPGGLGHLLGVGASHRLPRGRPFYLMLERDETAEPKDGAA